MADRDDIVQMRDVPAAIGLLSRLPVMVNTDRATARGAKAAWAYPLAGLAIGLLACFIGQCALWLGLSGAVSAGLVIASLVLLTGAMHEDGLADTADGLWGGWSKEHRLKIMKDTHIGTYGVVALVLCVGLRWQALGEVIDQGTLWAAVLSVAILSRAVMVPMMALLPNARDHGLSHAVGRPDMATACIAYGIASLAALILLHMAGLWLIALTALSATACAAIAKTKIGGQTGDILGATQQITEISLLLALSSLLS